MAQHYDKQFKLDAIKYREDHPELTIAAVCRNLGISQPTYYIWLRQFKENDGEIEHRGSGNYSSDLEKENAQLKKELKAQKDALEILKKQSAFWAKNPNNL
jgi:transposase